MTTHSETDLAKLVVAYLQEWKWEVYQEVIGDWGRCDIVAKQGQILWAIECKITLGISVLEQAWRWRRNTHYISVATPRSPSRFVEKICRDYGIGMLTARLQSGRVDESVRPKLMRKIQPIKLIEEQKTWGMAGTNGGDYYSPFKHTVRNLITDVRKKPGIEFNELIKNLDYHYQALSTAKSCLRGFIGTSVIPELRFETVDGKLCVFLSQEAAA